MSRPGSELFMKPPDPKHPQYYEIMENYIDLCMIERKLREGEYNGSFSLIQDLRNIFSKSVKYAKSPQDTVALNNIK